MGEGVVIAGPWKFYPLATQRVMSTRRDGTIVQGKELCQNKQVSNLWRLGMGIKYIPLDVQTHFP
jgi:hypothetical protein